MNDVILKTERTELKFPLPFITSQIVVEAIGDKETVKFMDSVPTMEYTEEDATNFMNYLKYTEKSDEELELGIFDMKTKKFIGMCTLKNINKEDSVCELGYWLEKSYVGNGYMTECCKAVIQYAKDELHMKALNAFVITEHLKSIALLERLGFIRKEPLKNDTENKGELVDRYWYKLLLRSAKSDD